ncbi:MAG TPA: hypothetical protein VLE74_03795 [Candidatus Saccharimonadales bacterium]|nr:hypothetical protein [Candidatus Saccharimonadales bacterium]
MDRVQSDKPTKKKTKKMSLPLFGLAMFLVGAFVIVAIRFATVKNNVVHYHANFALYINGQRDEFKNFTFYEEESACTQNDPDNVKGRVHMHDQVADLVHIHAHGVTWGQFFANLGYTLGDKVVVTDNGVFADGADGNQLRFMLNGQTVQTAQDRVIKSEDVLLIDYGNDSGATLQTRYNAIPRTAHAANTENDPATCSGSKPPTFTERLKQAVGLSQASH